MLNVIAFPLRLGPERLPLRGDHRLRAEANGLAPRARHHVREAIPSESNAPRFFMPPMSGCVTAQTAGFSTSPSAAGDLRLGQKERRPKLYSRAEPVHLLGTHGPHHQSPCQSRRRI